MLVGTITAAVARHPWMRRAVTSTPVVRDLAWRFVAGESLEAGLDVARELASRGLRATLNHVGTHVREAPVAREAARAASRALAGLRAAGLEPNLSVKLTQLGLDLDEGLCRELLWEVLAGARAAGGFVRIDMEESGYVDRTLAIFGEARAAHGPELVGIVHPSYLRGREADLERLIASRARVRLVKGGYWESARVALRDRGEIDAAFRRDIARLVRAGHRPAIGTHDPAAIAFTRRVAAEAGLAPAALEFQMLYGVRPDLQASLARDGYGVRVYVPWGSGWYEYVLGCLRRVPGGAVRRLRDRLGVRREDRPGGA
jgi:proline dehydrogenase